MSALHSVFYNANYNEGSSNGQYKYVWGVKTLDMNKDLQSQILGEDNDAYNFNLTSLNVIGEVNYEKVEDTPEDSSNVAKPKKEKRFIAWNPRKDGPEEFSYLTLALAQKVYEGQDIQIIEIEVEV
ncbi:hypothetical protein SIPHO076v1_p0013 [Vibrio phage PS34B.1]|nr:hypothetical protein SIPHO076v1_p0013 [Vibrio phage PS34B.1]